MKIARLGTQDVIFRHQALNLDLSNQGLMPLTWGSVSGQEFVPMHIYNLSFIPNGGITLHGQAAGLQCGWATGSGTSDRTLNTLSGNDPTGLLTTPGVWWPETNGTIDFNKVTKAMHKWTSIKLQLYGSLQDDVKFTISMVKFPDEFADLWNGNVGNGQGKELQTFLTHQYTACRINSAQNTASRYIKVLREWNVTVPRQNVAAQVGVAQRELNLFVRHNWVNDYNWPTPTVRNIQNHDYVGALGYGVDFEKHTCPEPSKSVFLLVRATSTIKVSNEGQLGLNNGTYNIVIRNAFTVPC